MGWHQQLLIGFDLETTGTDPREARIVTGAVIEVRAGAPMGRREWLADPGVEIPADAVAVHGISNERATAEGRPADQVADAIADALKAVVDMALESCRSLIEGCGHRLSVALPPEPLYLDADPVRITQVVINLLNNAAKSTEPGGEIWRRAWRCC